MPSKRRETCRYCDRRAYVNARGVILAHRSRPVPFMGREVPCPGRGLQSYEEDERQRRQAEAVDILAPTPGGVTP